MTSLPQRPFNAPYEGAFQARVAFPLGGMGAGMLCIEGAGALSHVSVRNAPDMRNEPMMFGALKVLEADQPARILEGPVPSWKVFGPPGTERGAKGSTYGFPRFESAEFSARFPFSTVDLAHSRMPLRCSVVGWSPFTPGNAFDSCLPLAVLEYGFHNPSTRAVRAVFSFHAANFMSTQRASDYVAAVDGGFALRQSGAHDAPHEEGAFAVTCTDPAARTDCAWFRGGWFDAATMLWARVEAGEALAKPSLRAGKPSPGGSLYVPLGIAPGETKTITVLLSWYVPATRLNETWDAKPQQTAGDASGPTHAPWYAARFASIDEVTKYARSKLVQLREDSARFRDCFYDTTLPAEVTEAIASNLTILKSPTVLRQADGRLWCWEGCGDTEGSCWGSCTHVWNYAQALAHLFPDLERTLRHSEFHESQGERGYQLFRTALPIRPQQHLGHAAADGQLGGIMKVYREWRISGDIAWLREIWPKVRSSLDYCIDTWDPQEIGALLEPHHNTYDIEFWGANGMSTSFYVGALRAAVLMGQALGRDVTRYASLSKRAREYMEEELFNGEYFIQKVQWTGLKAGSPTEAKALVAIDWSEEALALLQKEGPKYQYGNGCLSDGVLGAWIADVCGVGEILDADKLRSHLRAVHRYNLRRDLSDHVNAQRPGFALGKEGGLLLCTWPRGGKLSLPFVYSSEVWTGVEYQVACHLITLGCVEEGLEIVRIVRSRYDGRIRNPFNEYECGHWYGRALSSYGLLQSLTGVRYDAPSKILHIEPRIDGDFRSFLCTASGYATVGVAGGKPFVSVCSGQIEIDRIAYQAAIPDAV